MRILLVGKNRYLWQKLRLMLPTDEVALVGGGALPSYDRLIWDTATAAAQPKEDAILISEGGALSPLFTKDELLSALGDAGRLTLDREARVAVLDGRRIKLTELEAALLCELMSREGEYVCRAELIRRVWGEDGNDGLINLYIHYLREKLEPDSERFIFSSRKLGYKLEISKKGVPNNARNQ